MLDVIREAGERRDIGAFAQKATAETQEAFAASAVAPSLPSRSTVPLSGAALDNPLNAIAADNDAPVTAEASDDVRIVVGFLADGVAATGKPAQRVARAGRYCDTGGVIASPPADA